jgi:hypothetical protein
MVVSLTTGIVYALVLPRAIAQNVTLASGNANLEIYNHEKRTWSDVWQSNFEFKDMYPGYLSYKTFSLRNKSLSKINLIIVGSLQTQNRSENWQALKDKILIEVWSNDMVRTGFRTLNQWEKGNFSFLGGGLKQGEKRDYRFYVQVKSDAGNEIANKSISQINFVFTGTQTK